VPETQKLLFDCQKLDLTNASAPPAPIRFGSRHEAAVGMILERYIPGFELRMGESLQVPIGFGRTADFRIDNVFLEYHPFNLHQAFCNYPAYRQLATALQGCRTHVAQQILEALKTELSEQYFKKRRFAIDQTHGRNFELVVAQDFKEVYKFILCRFASELPSFKTLEKEFRKLASQSPRH
jgi:hypothetical protein